MGSSGDRSRRGSFLWGFLATGIAALILRWRRARRGTIDQSVEEPDDTAAGRSRLPTVFDKAVGVIDLYLRDDIRGFRRLVESDPDLTGIGGGAARSVAVDPSFGLTQRLEATRLLAEAGRLDDRFLDRFMSLVLREERSAFLGLDPELDRRLKLDDS